LKFAMAYSMGKDCTLTLQKMIEAGHEPVCLLVIGSKHGFSMNHRVSRTIAEKYSDALGIPLVFGEWNFFLDTESSRALVQQIKDQYGAEAMCFGFMDSMESWAKPLCRETGLEYFAPLWHIDHEECMNQQLDNGYKCRIVTIPHFSPVPKDLIFKELDRDVVEKIRQSGADICGENGEYHTLVTDCPIFRHPVSLACLFVLNGKNSLSSFVV